MGKWKQTNKKNQLKVYKYQILFKDNNKMRNEA